MMQRIAVVITAPMRIPSQFTRHKAIRLIENNEPNQSITPKHRLKMATAAAAAPPPSAPEPPQSFTEEDRGFMALAMEEVGDVWVTYRRTYK